MEEVSMAKGTRITVDLGSEELLKAVKFASVEQNKPIREIIIEALEQWLGKEKLRTAGLPGHDESSG
jgi:hypothetical protein